MSKIKIGLIALAIFGLGSITGYYLKPAEIKIVKEKTEDKKAQEDTKTNLLIVKKKITRPDGTVEEEETRKREKEKSTKTESHISIKEERTEKARSKWSISLLLKPQDPQPFQGGVIEYKVLGPVKAGVYVLPTHNQYGISVGMEF